MTHVPGCWKAPAWPLALLIWLAMIDGAKSAGIACGVVGSCMGSGVRAVVGGRFCGSLAGWEPLFCTNALQ